MEIDSVILSFVNQNTVFVCTLLVFEQHELLVGATCAMISRRVGGYILQETSQHGKSIYKMRWGSGIRRKHKSKQTLRSDRLLLG